MKEILKNLVQTAVLPEDAYLEQDADILEIFVEELQEIFETLPTLVGQWIENPNQEDVLVTIRRNFHTLKGSGRMVGAKSSSELAWTVEDTLNRVISKTVQITPELQQYVNAVVNVYQYKFFPDFQVPRDHSIDFRPLILLGQELQQSQELTPALGELLVLAETLTDEAAPTGLEIKDETIESSDHDQPKLEIVHPNETVIRDFDLVEEETESHPIELDQEPVFEFVTPLDENLIIDLEDRKEVVDAEKVDLVALDEEEDNLSETLEIFFEEAEEHISTIQRFVDNEQNTPDQYNRLTRALHTLRGSSSMAHIDDISQVTGKVDQAFKVFVQEGVEIGPKEHEILQDYVAFVSDYIETLKKTDYQKIDLVIIQRKFMDLWETYESETNRNHPVEHVQSLVTELVNLDIDVLLDAEFEFDKKAQTEYPSYFETLSQQAELLISHTNSKAARGIQDFTLALKTNYDAVLDNQSLLNSDYAYELFAEVHQHFIHLFDALASGQQVVLGDDSKRALEELHVYLTQYSADESGAAVELSQIEILEHKQHETETDLVDDVSDIQTSTEELDHEALDKQALSLSEQAIEDVADQQLVEAVEEIIAPNLQTEFDVNSSDHSQYFAHLVSQIAADKSLKDSDQSNYDFDADVLDIFIEEADELLGSIDTDLNNWSLDLTDTQSLKNLMRHLHTLKGGANMAQAEHIGLIAHELETIYESIINGQMHADDQLVKAVRLIQDDIADRLQIITDEQVDYPATNVIAVLKDLVKAQKQESYEAETAQADVIDEHVDIDDVEEHQSDSTEVHALVDQDASAQEADDLDVQNIYAEEAEQLIDEAFTVLKQWIEQRSNRSLLLQLQRVAHSLKGGAKMANLTQVADISYELETAFERFGLHNFSSNAYDALLHSAFEWLKGAILNQHYEHFATLKNKLSNIEYVDVSAQLPNKLTRTDLLAQEYEIEFVEGDGTEPPSMLGEWDDSASNESNDEMIRISADMIEKMIDLSGENAINRSRIEMDLSQLGNTLTEMELAIQRLADQLRRMEGELESQIIAKHGDSTSRYADFDPLEMDQYSSLNQLSKSLAESASDLVDFKTTLSEKIKDTEGILLQQSRIQAEIQESLMRARLVPFSRLLPRLQRLVRQVSTTLNKPTELHVNNTEGELDRTILEKLISPLEHMLRNALDHGIEQGSVRLEKNKPAVGKIELDISRQGTDVIVTFTDDGQGIDSNKIRSKALGLGLIQAGEELTREEILQFIFHPGFSTAEKVTQISGRGVGLDVVQSGIKSLGGEVTVESEVGKGSTFRIRVPTTVAVSDALMVKVLDQQFAVPLSQIERIIRISPIALEDFFATDDDYFEIDHKRYKLRYLGEYVGTQVSPKLNGIAHSLPVLLIKGPMGQTVALLVDQLVGSHSQIVVKPIGGQFANVGAIAGATILGDGQVCLILDGQSIARQIQVGNRDANIIANREQSRHRDQRRLVMIVDDSVTVRKVTSRLLERNGFDVITAKDGVDAIEQLENVKPDLMLLDIEMPRMDGFEVTTLVRHHELHSELPIIMITSRTGEKHRERAFSLGVTNYMGKPFQEAELLSSIQKLLETK